MRFILQSILPKGLLGPFYWRNNWTYKQRCTQRRGGDGKVVESKTLSWNFQKKLQEKFNKTQTGCTLFFRLVTKSTTLCVLNLCVTMCINEHGDSPIKYKLNLFYDYATNLQQPRKVISVTSRKEGRGFSQIKNSSFLYCSDQCGNAWNPF